MTISNKNCFKSVLEGVMLLECNNFYSEQSWSIILSTAVAELGSGYMELDYSLPPL